MSVRPESAVLAPPDPAQTPCDPATNTYTQVVVVTYENAPVTGNLVVNGPAAWENQPENFTLMNGVR